MGRFLLGKNTNFGREKALDKSAFERWIRKWNTWGLEILGLEK